MKTTVNAYVSFNGTCEAAFNFYKSIFGGEFAYIGRYKDMPSEQPIPESDMEKIMHISLPLGEGTVLMGADMAECFGQKITFGDNISLSVNAASDAEAKRIFAALADGGKITMPMEVTFWGALFGMAVDKFGVLWMVNFDMAEGKK